MNPYDLSTRCHTGYEQTAATVRTSKGARGRLCWRELSEGNRVVVCEEVREDRDALRGYLLAEVAPRRMENEIASCTERYWIKT